MIFTIEEARDILRIDGGDNDAIIEPLIDAIPPYLEATTGYAKPRGIIPLWRGRRVDSFCSFGTTAKTPIRTSCSV